MTPDELLAALDRWESSGGHWSLLEEWGRFAVFGLYTCDGGELMSQASGPVSEDLRRFLAGRTSSQDDPRP